MNKYELKGKIREKEKELKCLKKQLKNLKRYSFQDHDDCVGRDMFKFGNTNRTHPFCAYDNHKNRSVAWFVDECKCKEYVDFLNNNK